MILLFNSECCNLGSVASVLDKTEIPYIISKEVRHLRKKVKILLLPGVGSYDAYIASLKQTGFWQEIKKLTVERKLKILGICSGAQVLFESSEEGIEKGLGLLPGRVQHLSPSEESPVPHIGWNNIRPSNIKKDQIYIEQEQPFYFCHSYRFPESKYTVAYTEYGERFPVIVSNGQVTAIQFHPEKSYFQGLELLRNIILSEHVKTKNNTSIAVV